MSDWLERQDPDRAHLLDRRVRLTLQHVPWREAVEGILLRVDIGGEAALLCDDHRVHYCWPVLEIENLEETMTEPMRSDTMSGEEHYLEAERLLTEAAGIEAEPGDPASWTLLQRAQVHAGLAYTSAAAMATGQVLRGGVGQWRRPTPPPAEYTGEPTEAQRREAQEQARI